MTRQGKNTERNVAAPHSAGRMRLAGVIGEAWRDVTSGAAHVALYTLILALLSCAGILMESAALTAIERARSAYIASGASTYMLAYKGHVSAPACEALNNTRGVMAAGALREADQRISMAKLPSMTVPTWDATPGAIRLLASSDTDTVTELDAGTYQGVWMSRQAAEATGATADSLQPLKGGGSVQVSGIYPYPDDDGRDTASFSYAALQAVSAEPGVAGADSFDVCLVKTWPVPDDMQSLLTYAVATVDDSGTQYPTIGQLNTTLGTQFDAEDQWAARQSRWAPLALLTAGLALGFVSITVRRLALASSLHCGVPKTALTLQMLLETLAWALAAALITLPAAAWARLTWSAGDLAAIDDTLIRIPLAGMTGALAGALAATLLTREKHMFRYFKNR